MAIKYNYEMEQGTEAWFAARLGLLTASEMKHIITAKKLEPANNDKTRAHVYELAAQRISQYVEPSYVSDDMLRGREDEIDALEVYSEHYDRVKRIGFVTNDKWGFKLGFSPDALVGEDGIIEVKGRRQKFQVETILNNAMPEEYMMQVQTGLLVTERKWCDFISYSAGLPMATIRVFPDEVVQNAIVAAAQSFEEKVGEMLNQYQERLSDKDARLIETERRIELEITV